MNNLSDQLQSKVFRNLENLADFRNCRLVSQKWKRTVMAACRDKFHLVYPLTDSTLYTAGQLKDAPVSFDIHSFTGEENNDAWPTSGLDPLMRTTEWLQFSGSEVNEKSIREILSLAHDSLKILGFKCLRNDLTYPLLKMQETFGALRKLSVGYYSTEKNNDTFSSLTTTLENWNSLDCIVQLPLLESLSFYFDSRSGIVQHVMYSIQITTEDLFRNYIAIANLLLKHKKSLKEVQIERVFADSVSLFSPYSLKPEWSEMERGLEALDDLNLNHLKLGTKYKLSYLTENCDLVVEVLGRPKNLKNVLFNNLICPFDNWYPLMATLSSFLNVDSNYLTRVKIELVLRTFPDSTLVINVGGLRECRNLRTLWLKVNTRNTDRRLSVRNVELLPRDISILHFENADEPLRLNMAVDEILVNQQQLRWIIDNLRGLESFRMGLVIPEPTRPVNNEGDGNAQLQQQRQEEINRLVNINLDTFRDLIAMPTLKNVKVNMMKGLSIAAGAGGGMPVGMGSTLDDVREYSDLCEAAVYTTTTTTTSPYFGANYVFGYATLTIQRNPN